MSTVRYPAVHDLNQEIPAEVLFPTAFSTYTAAGLTSTAAKAAVRASGSNTPLANGTTGSPNVMIDGTNGRRLIAPQGSKRLTFQFMATDAANEQFNAAIWGWRRVCINDNLLVWEATRLLLLPDIQASSKTVDALVANGTANAFWCDYLNAGSIVDTTFADGTLVVYTGAGASDHKLTVSLDPSGFELIEFEGTRNGTTSTGAAAFNGIYWLS